MFEHIPHPNRRAFLAAFVECGNRSEAAKLADVSREAHYDWLRDPEYAAAFELAEQMAGDALEDLARQRAIGVGPDNNRILLKLLSGLKPERYGTRRIESTSTVKHQHLHAHIDLTSFSDDELKILERLANKARTPEPRSDHSGEIEAAAAEVFLDVPGNGTTEA